MNKLVYEQALVIPIVGGESGIVNANVVDNLKSFSTTDALSANQGRVLDGKIYDLANRVAPATDESGNVIETKEQYLMRIPMSLRYVGMTVVLNDGFRYEFKGGIQDKNLVRVEVPTGEGGGSSVDVVDSLTSSSTDKALSANQGKILNESKVSNETFQGHTRDYFNPHKTTAEQVGAAAKVHRHDVADIDNLTPESIGAADRVHTHVISDITGLQGALDSKLNKTIWDSIFELVDGGIRVKGNLLANGDVVAYTRTGIEGGGGGGLISKVYSESELAKEILVESLTETFSAKAIKSIYDRSVTNTQNITNHESNRDNPHGVTKTQVGLSNVDNTSDANKPISNTTQEALNGKLGKTEKASDSSYSDVARTVSGNYSGNGGRQNPSYIGKGRVRFNMMNTSVNGNSGYKDFLLMDCYAGNDVGGAVAFGVNRQSLGAYIMRSDSDRVEWNESAELWGTHNFDPATKANKSDLDAHKGNANNPHSVTAAQVGAPTLSEYNSHKGNTSNPHNVTKAQVGLGNVDNTSDLNKPISNATQAALDKKLDKSIWDGIFELVEGGIKVKGNLLANGDLVAFSKTGIEGGGSGGGGLITRVYGLANLGTDVGSESLTETFSAKAIQDIYNRTVSASTDLLNHKGDRNNPHGVTISQIGAAPAAHDHDRVLATDKIDIKPNTTGTHTLKAIKPFFTRMDTFGISSGTYGDCLVLDTYSDGSGGYINALITPKGSDRPRLFIARGGWNTDSWLDKAEVWTNLNFDPATKANRNGDSSQDFNANTLSASRITLSLNSVTTTIESGNTSYTHYRSTATAGHWFNKSVYVDGEIYAGTGYGSRVWHNGNSGTESFDWSAKNITLNGAIKGCISVVSNTTNGYFIGNAANGLGGSNTGGLFYAYGNNPLHFYTNGASRMHIRGDGNIGVGTDYPNYKLTIGDSDSGFHWHSDGLLSAYANGVQLFNWNSQRVYFNNLIQSNSSSEFRGNVTAGSQGENNYCFFKPATAGFGWGNGNGALTVDIRNNGSQTPLVVSRREGTDGTGANRMFFIEQLNDGNWVYMGLNGNTIFRMHATGNLHIDRGINSKGTITSEKDFLSTGQYRGADTTNNTHAPFRLDQQLVLAGEFVPLLKSVTAMSGRGYWQNSLFGIRRMGDDFGSFQMLLAKNDNGTSYSTFDFHSNGNLTMDGNATIGGHRVVIGGGSYGTSSAPLWYQLAFRGYYGGDYALIRSVEMSGTSAEGKLEFLVRGAVGAAPAVPNLVLSLDAARNARFEANVYAKGEVVAYSTSDKRFKKDVKKLEKCTDFIDKLNPVSYYWNSRAKELMPHKSDSVDFGLIAQELEEVCPELVHTIFDEYKSIDYVKLIPFLIGAIQELNKKVKDLCQCQTES